MSLRQAPYFWLFVFALLLRLAYLAESTANPLFGVALVDGRVYEEWAGQMASGRWLWDSVGNYLPIYPLFLALLKFFFGPSPIVYKWAQAALGALGAVLIGRVAERLWDRRVGLTAGCLTAGYWLLIVYEGEPYAEPFSIFFQTLALFLLVSPRLGIGRCLAAGVALALSAGARANLLLLLPFVAGWVFWASGPAWRRAIVGVAGFVTGTALVLGPIALRNRQITGEWVLRRQAAWSLYSGLAPEFRALPIPPGVVFDNQMRQPIQAGLRSREEIEEYWAERTVALLRENPIGVGGVLFRRFFLLLNAREFPKEFDVHAYRGYSRVLSLPWPGFWLVGPLGLVGLAAAGPWTKSRALPALLLILGWGSLIPFKFADRYRLPVGPLLAIFAAVALWAMWEARRRGARRRLLGLAGAWAALCVVAWPDWMNLKADRISRHNFFIGGALAEAGQQEAALEAYGRSMREFPWDADSPYAMGIIHLARDEAEAAGAMLEEALRREPDFPEAMAALARLRERQGDLATAQSLLEESLQLYPTYPTALMQLAGLHRRRGQTGAELALIARAIEAGGGPPVALTLALRLDDLANMDDAREIFERVAADQRADPFTRARALILAGRMEAVRRGDLEAARGFWARAALQAPLVPFFALQARFLLGEIDESTFRREMEALDSPTALEFAEYTIGLHRRLRGDLDGARAAYGRCLSLAGQRSSDEPPAELPQRWAWEELRILEPVRIPAALPAEASRLPEP